MLPKPDFHFVADDALADKHGRVVYWRNRRQIGGRLIALYWWFRVRFGYTASNHAPTVKEETR